MRKTGLLIVIGFILTFNANAKRLKGIIILEDDTLGVTFRIPVTLFAHEIEFEKIQRKIKYFDTAGKKSVIKPDQAEEIRFYYKNKEIRLLSRFIALRLHDLFSKNHYYFLKLEMDGKLKLLRYYYTEDSPEVYEASSDVMITGQSYTVSKYILQKSDEELFMPRTLAFRKDMMKYFQDCPELINMIENRKYRKRDMVNIARYYNSYCHIRKS